jgi:hypothetical protein
MQGLSGVTHSKVARRSKVSRGWIYEYIGKEKSDLTRFAAEVFAEEFARVGNNLPGSVGEIRQQLDDGIRFLFDCAMADPVIIRLYFRFRGANNALGKIIELHEEKWLTCAAGKLAVLTQLPSERCMHFANLMLALRLGACHQIVTSENPLATRQQVENTFCELHAFVEVGTQLPFLR